MGKGSGGGGGGGKGRSVGGGGGGSNLAFNDKAALQGSEKQVAWAQDIREKHIEAAKSELANAEARAASMKASGNFNEREAAMLGLRREIIKSIIDDIASNTSAKDFIDNRVFKAFKSRAVAKNIKNIDVSKVKTLFPDNTSWRRWI